MFTLPLQASATLRILESPEDAQGSYVHRHHIANAPLELYDYQHAAIERLLRPKCRNVVRGTVLMITPRQHKKRRNQSDAYHKRVQKKWDKRAKTDPRFQEVSPARTMAFPPQLSLLIESCGKTLKAEGKSDK